MLKHTLRSLFTLIFTALVGSVVVFVLLRQLGGDVVTVFLGRDAAPIDVSYMREELGLNQPLIVQYLDWIRGIFTGDLGKSYGMGYDISDELMRRLGPTLTLTIGGLLISVPLALALGTYSAINAKKMRSSFVDVFYTSRNCRSGILGRSAPCFDLWSSAWLATNERLCLNL